MRESNRVSMTVGVILIVAGVLFLVGRLYGSRRALFRPYRHVSKHSLNTTT